MFKRLVNNMRRGFATNSSSSHSLVYFKEPVGDTTPPKPGDLALNGGRLSFGWEDFTLSSLTDKLVYALVTAVGEGWWRSDITKADRVHELYEQYGHLFPEFNEYDFAAAMDGDVDHQSVHGIEELVKLARDPHVVIYGGNDNSGTTLTDTLHYAGDKAEWGMSLSWGEKVTPEENEEEWEERKKWAW